MSKDLTTGPITKSLLIFALPMMAGNLLQQFYNVADTLIVGRFLGKEALAAVGSAYALMTFLTSVILGLCMGSGVVISLCYGKKDRTRMGYSVFQSFVLITGLSLVMTGVVFAGMDGILKLLQVPAEIYQLLRSYLWVIFWGIFATCLYNYYASLLRAVGNSTVPLVFLGVSAVLNIGLDLLFVLKFHWGVRGAAGATVLAQYVSGLGILFYTIWQFPEFRLRKSFMKWDRSVLKEILQMSVLTSVQQSIMNFGILMVQGLVNSFGTAVMAAFSAAVKIDTFAYMPVQDFGNAFSTFVAQNFGAKKMERIREGMKKAFVCVLIFCIGISVVVFAGAKWLLLIFIKAEETEILQIGCSYLRIEGTFYCLIGFLFLFYGIYRALKRPGMSVVLTICSLGTRVVLAYLLSAIPALNVNGIWMSVPIGWFLADLVGIFYLERHRVDIFGKIVYDEKQ